MRFILMHKHDPKFEAGERPPPGLIEKMGAFIGEHAQKGVFLDGAGLGKSANRTRLTFRGGQLASVKPGPYTGERELPNALLLLSVTTKDEAIGWAERYGKLLGDGELELGALNEPWDLGLMEKPAAAPLRFLLVEKADAASEAGTRSAKQKADLTRLKTEMTKAGVLGGTDEHLEPSRTGKRLVFTRNQLAVLDGPFAESKELIGGFSVMRLESFDEAIALTRRFAEILGGTLEVDLRVLVEA